MKAILALDQVIDEYRDYLRTAWTYGWHLSAAFYCRAMQAITGEPHRYWELAVESVPPRIRVEAISAVSPPSTTGGRQQLSQMTDGASPPTPLQFANPYLSAGAWELTTDAAWVGDADARDRLDGSSASTTAADLEVLQAETGPLQQGRVYTAGIQACATGWSRERSPCQLFPYRLTVVDDLERRYLPFVALPRAQR